MSAEYVWIQQPPNKTDSFLPATVQEPSNTSINPA